MLEGMPRYMKIAVDVATKIYHGDFKEGEKILGRSTLAGEYNVSPETIRRSMTLLEDMEVVTVAQGSGIYVNSKENAYKFMERFRSKESIGTLKNKMKKLITEKQSLEEQIQEILQKIIDYSDSLKSISPINPMEIEIPPECHLVGQTISESKFWQNTGATIVGIRRDDQLIISPGPYAEFEVEDTILVVGDPQILERIKEYIGE